MDRHGHLHHQALLEILLALFLVTTLASLALCSQSAHVGGGASSLPGGTGSPQQQAIATSGNPADTKLDSSSSGPSVAQTSIDPSSLSAGTPLSMHDIEQSGGVDAFFWAEEISDEVFARMEGKSYKADCGIPLEDLRYLKLLYKNADGNSFVGEMVVHRNVADEVLEIFRELYDASYPIRKMVLVDEYDDASDDLSCTDGNSSAFNWRLISGTDTISNHAYGLAIDINTFENPYYIPAHDYVFPPEARRYIDRSLSEPYMIHRGDLCYQLFIERGWTWGGDWSTPKDYQHFEKPQALYE